MDARRQKSWIRADESSNTNSYGMVQMTQILAVSAGLSSFPAFYNTMLENVLNIFEHCMKSQLRISSLCILHSMKKI